MTDKPGGNQERLAEALRANLRRRKAQARARAAQDLEAPRISGNSANPGPSSANKIR
jgi:hypothetical protein